MSNQKSKVSKKDKKPSYWQRVIYGKGTVAEPWATEKELWEDPQVQEIIQWNNNLIKQKNKSIS